MEFYPLKISPLYNTSVGHFINIKCYCFTVVLLSQNNLDINSDLILSKIIFAQLGVLLLSEFHKPAGKKQCIVPFPFQMSVKGKYI